MAFIASTAALTRTSINRASTDSLRHRTSFQTTRSTRAVRMTASTDAAQTSTTLQSFLFAARELGTIRFVAVTPGAILETIGRFDYGVNTFSVPGKGEYLTLASADKTFECHINLSKAKQVTLGQQKAKVGDHDIYVIRFMDDKDILLSCMLMWDPSKGPGNYLHGAVDAFKELETRFGNRFTLSTA